MRTLAALAVVLALAAGEIPAEATGEWLGPVTKDEMTFPVARSDWYSVINFQNDWHAPRMRLIDGRWRQIGVHEGNDIFAEPGTPVRAILAGTVERVGWTFYSGWRAGIRGTDGRYWFYAHLKGFAPGIRQGADVETGDELGYVGNTGYGAEPGHSGEFTYHLHVGIQEAGGAWVNPYPLMRRLYRAAVNKT
ncbi:MAG TPA: M23 family metallopeptidase [Actinomycetota bacterium]|jgi:murein DD-endopeptidase MepM/ murein hydrolase activator NlpD|nr:M23 family metallopeptidase [Actinomycetota bacterium]